MFPQLETGKVEYIGSVGPAERNRLLGGAHAMLHPINFNEPFGLSVIEVMACGTPVIAFNRGSMPEIVLHGKNGFLVHSPDAAIKAVSEIEKIDRNYCRHYVEKYFTADCMIEEYIEVYNRILKGNVST